MGVDLYTSFQNYHCFWPEKWGSTYTRENKVIILTYPGVYRCSEVSSSGGSKGGGLGASAPPFLSSFYKSEVYEQKNYMKRV